MVRLVERVNAEPVITPEEFETMLRERQQARGHQPRSNEEIDAYLLAERDSWDQCRRDHPQGLN